MCKTASATFYTTTIPSPIGELTLASDGENLTGLWLAGQKYFGAGLPPQVAHVPTNEAVANSAPSAPNTPIQTNNDLPLFHTVRDWLTRYFNGENPDARALPLAPAGSPFRQTVWQALLDIPYGTTTTYGALAQQVGCVSARAVGGAVGHNPISILIPCHRVVGAGGKLTGYAGGVAAKVFLLRVERIIV